MIKELFLILNSQQRKDFYKLQLLVVLMAFLEIFGIASIAPFMALVADPGVVVKNGVLGEIYRFSGVNDVKKFIAVVGSCVLLSLTVASLVSMFTTWKLSLYAMKTGAEISDRLFIYYLNQNWIFHSSGSSAQLTKQITTESVRVTHNIIQPFMILNAKIVLVLFVGVGVVFFNPLIAFSGIFIFVGGYFLIYKIVKKFLIVNGSILSEVSTKRFRLINEGLGGIRDIILLNRANFFIEKFVNTGENQATAQAVNSSLGQIPRYFMELIAFGSMIILILILIQFNDSSLIQVLPLLAVYALSGLKILPSLQQIYSCITTIKGSISAFQELKNDLIGANNIILSKSTEQLCLNLKNYKKIVLKDISFSYPCSACPALSSISLDISFNTTVGFVGESGSGKSTLIDLIVGLIDPSHGKLMLDNEEINNSNKIKWQSNIGFVSQNIFLSEGTIAENIAFGINELDINWDRIKKSVRQAHLQDLIDELPYGLSTRIGERGVKLSGGQRQRIGIARALYTDAKILVFDEATSALDGLTEKKIMSAINEMKNKRTIIMIAHRLKTIKNCEQIFLLDKGRLLDHGSYDELKERNIKFSEMDKYA